ncbi:RNA polymerase sigma factor [Actinoplanes aureus]|uniref:Sigma-70 family RNA polymerase sigma factor n=1 Tax=Actinoplanes aureus TaxID=2792083 RepID=A0A931FZB9_9ACTN|nr:sigma-70 family RNA polymerase sigma factor [Actinoplanes aureus]MBG0565543.1 sigma-70 family RNA polymerase sigma factor [Actinoplanes aureus]
MTRLSILVARAANREESAWTELVAEFGPMMRSIAAGYRLTREEGADAAQITWLRLLAHIDRIREPDRIAGWLAITMRHECCRIVRQRGREQRLEEWMAVEDDTEQVVARLLHDERTEALWYAVERLPARQRRLMRALSHASAPSYQEVAAAMSMPVGSVGPTRARALSRLRELLTEDGAGRPLDPAA